VWIRSSTGHLCIDLAPPQTNPVSIFPVDDRPLPPGTSLFAPPSGSDTMMSMSLRMYHEICNLHLCRVKSWSVSPNVSVELGSTRYLLGPEYEGSLEVASSNCSIHGYGWSTMDPIVKGYSHLYVPSKCVSSNSDEWHEWQIKLGPRGDQNYGKWLDQVHFISLSSQYG
jgi:hypothetical protein